MSGIGELAAFFFDHRGEILERTVEHIGLTVVAMMIAVCIGLPLGVMLTRRKKIAGPVLGAIGVIQTIPSVALLGLLLPLLGIGAAPAIVALFLYALLPIVRNTYTGINEVSGSVTEAARGMGMTDTQILIKVELPLAAPVIFAGVRTATIINVGIATLCALIAAGGLGEFIFRGIALNNVQMVMAGAIPAALLALLFDLVLSLVQKYLRRVLKPVLAVGAVVMVAALAAAIVSRAAGRDTTRAGFTAEFMERADGYPGLRNAYGLDLETVELDPGLMYKALKEGKVDVIGGFSTDGRIRAYNLLVLEDDRHFFPPYHAAPIVRGETMRKNPVLAEVFAKLEGRISNEEMAELNFRVDRGGETPAGVAHAFLREAGFKTSVVRDGEGDFIVGSKNFTEQFILARMFEILVENYSDLDVELKTGLAGTKICFDALAAGEIDCYPEYTGTGLLVILKADEQTRDKLITDRDHVYAYVKEASKARYDVDWLFPLGFNNSYALMMRSDDARRLGIETISDLENHLQGSRQAGKPGTASSITIGP